jgi:FAD/FMN-containing dehydrogenase
MAESRQATIVVIGLPERATMHDALGPVAWTSIISRKFGLSVDSLRSAHVVTADGGVRRVDDHTNPDLFWAIRGGGGNFGIVSEFEFALHPVGPTVLAGLLVHPFTDAPAVMRNYRSFVATAPDELTC